VLLQQLFSDINYKGYIMKVGIIMGSKSDWPTMQHAADMLDLLEVPYETKVVSAHRTPHLLAEYAENAQANGIDVIIAGAGGAAHLPGMTAAFTPLPVLGVPVQSKALSGQDSLLSIVQMPKGIAVGTLAIGNAGAANAGLLAAQIIGTHNAKIMENVVKFRTQQTQTILDNPDPAG
jgi:5-(carboxyamino)imidazole ribonucleotide mutase